MVSDNKSRLSSKPALGPTWSHLPNTRVFVYKSDRSSQNKTLQSTERIATLTKSSRQVGYRMISFCPLLRVMFHIPSDIEPWVASQRTQQCTVTMKQWTVHLTWYIEHHPLLLHQANFWWWFQASWRKENGDHYDDDIDDSDNVMHGNGNDSVLQ